MHTAARDTSPPRQDQTVPVIEAQNGMSSNNIPPAVSDTRKALAIAVVVSLGASFSPLAANIYYPLLPILSGVFHVSLEKINLSITVYMIIQALAPILTASISDLYGRRPAYLICLVLFCGANIGLALQRSYAGLMALRCVQSVGSSPTGVLANAVIVDIISPEKRGMFLGISMAGAFIAQSLGPTLGGTFARFADWSWTFWFLAIFSGVFFLVYALYIPETRQRIRRSQWYHQGLWSLWRKQTIKTSYDLNGPEPRPDLDRHEMLLFLSRTLDRRFCVLLSLAAFIYTSLAVVATSLPIALTRISSLDDFVTGLCYIPVGVGSCVAAIGASAISNANYRHHARREEDERGASTTAKRSSAIRARLEVVMPLVLLQTLCLVAYGWVSMYSHTLIGTLILLFFIGLSATGAFTVVNILLLELGSSFPGTVAGINNLTRCLLGAGGTAAILPLIGRIGFGWSFTLIGVMVSVIGLATWIVTSSC